MKYDLTCADCGSPMKPRMSKYRTFYGCSRYPVCKGAISCDKEGKPLGIPANKGLRDLRRRTHEAFDRLWKCGVVRNRSAAYRWLQIQLKLNPKDAHIAMLDKDQCDHVIRAVEKKLQKSGLARA